MKKILLSAILSAAAVLSLTAADTPTFPGGKEAIDKFIAKNLKYPEAAKAMGVEGVVTVQFIVKADSTIGNIKIVRMVDPDLEKEAIRLVKKMPAWNPADKDGVATDAAVKVEIPFTLSDPDE